MGEMDGFAEMPGEQHDDNQKQQNHNERTHSILQTFKFNQMNQSNPRQNQGRHMSLHTLPQLPLQQIQTAHNLLVNNFNDQASNLTCKEGEGNSQSKPMMEYNMFRSNSYIATMNEGVLNTRNRSTS